MNQAYFWSLADEPADTIQAAVREWMRTEKWFPKPAELITLAGEIAERQVREGVRSLPVPDVTYTTLDNLQRVRTLMVTFGIGTDKIDAAIAEARAREGQVA